MWCFSTFLTMRKLFFFNVGPPKEDIFFWPPSMAYILVIILHMLQITIFHMLDFCGHSLSRHFVTMILDNKQHLQPSMLSFFSFFCTRLSQGLLPVLGPLGGGTDAYTCLALPCGSRAGADLGWTSGSYHIQCTPLRAALPFLFLK